jgi:HisJ family histidinol phosphate phosphatase
MENNNVEKVYFDSHMHTPLCKHAYGEPEEYAERALTTGLKGIIFTCHSPMPDGFWPQVRMAMDQFDDYLALIERAREAYQGRLEIRLGMESDFFPGYESWIGELHGMADFHYCLGSVHWQGKDYMQRYETGDVLEFQKTYFRLLAESAETGLFDCLAHPDLVKNYEPMYWDFETIQPAIAEALDRIKATGCHMELNTSGLNKRYAAMNPGPDMLRMMAERAIPVVVGSDSHVSRRVGDQFPLALRMLKAAGYREVSVFQNRKPTAFAITDVEATLTIE